MLTKTLAVFRNPAQAIGLQWAEVKDGIPVHTGELAAWLCELWQNTDVVATVSDTVISIAAYFVRSGDYIVRVHYYKADGTLVDTVLDKFGVTIRPLPEEGFGSITEAAFYYRYERTTLEDQ